MEYLDPLQATEKPVTITQLLEMVSVNWVIALIRGFGCLIFATTSSKIIVTAVRIYYMH